MLQTENLTPTMKMLTGWGVLQTAQQVYYDATGEVVANDLGVVLIPGLANEDNFGKIIH